MTGSSFCRLRWERDTRYYEAEVRTDLFGTACVVLTYGGVATQRGRQRTLPYPTVEAALAAFQAVGIRRLRRGYALTRPAKNPSTRWPIRPPGDSP